MQIFCEKDHFYSQKRAKSSFDQLKLHILPKNIIKNGLSKVDNTFNLFQLQSCWLNNCNQHFRLLVNQLQLFNKQLQQLHKKFQIKNYLKTYHLYKNLYEQLHNVNIYSLNQKQANHKLFNISTWFFKQKCQIRQLQLKDKVFPGITHRIKEDKQQLRKTVYQIKNKRQYQVYNIMSKSTYSDHFLSKDRTLQYKNQQAQNQFWQRQQSVDSQSQNISSFFRSSPLKNESMQFMKSKIKLSSKIASTAYNSQYQDSSFNKLKSIESRISLKVVKNRSMSTTFISNKKMQKSLQFLKQTSGKYNSKVNKNRNMPNVDLMKDLLIKDNIQKAYNEPDNCEQKLFTQLDEKKTFQAGQFKTSKISFILNSQKHQRIDRKQFVCINSQLKKSKFNNSKLKTQLNRKLQFRKYLSNHQKSNGMQVLINKNHKSLSNLIGKNIISLATNSQNHNKNKDPQQNYDQLESKQSRNQSTYFSATHKMNNTLQIRKKQFQDSIKKQSLKRALVTYSKYFSNHLKEKNDNSENNSMAQSRQSFYKTNSQKFSQFNNTRQTLTQKRHQKMKSSTNFRFDSMRTNFSKQLAISKVLEKHKVQEYNNQAARNLLKIKLKLSQNNSMIKLQNNYITNNLIYKGLSVHQVDPQLQYQTITPKLFNNPFFIVQTGKKGSKKKRSKK